MNEIMKTQLFQLNFLFENGQNNQRFTEKIKKLNIFSRSIIIKLTVVTSQTSSDFSQMFLKKVGFFVNLI